MLVLSLIFIFFFFNDTATTEIYTLSLHDALPISAAPTRTAQFAYFAAFALGTMIGMLLVSFSLAGLVRLASGRGATWATALHLGSAVISVVVGLLLAGKTLQ